MVQFPIWEWQIQENVALFICGLCPLIHRFYPPLPLLFLYLIVHFCLSARESKKVNLHELGKIGSPIWPFTHLFLSSFVGVTPSPLGLDATLFCRQTSHMEVGLRWEKTRAFGYTMRRLTIAPKVQYEKKTRPNICLGAAIVNISWSQKIMPFYDGAISLCYRITN